MPNKYQSIRDRIAGMAFTPASEAGRGVGERTSPEEVMSEALSGAKISFETDETPDGRVKFTMGGLVIRIGENSPLGTRKLDTDAFLAEANHLMVLDFGDEEVKKDMARIMAIIKQETA